MITLADWYHPTALNITSMKVPLILIALRQFKFQMRGLPEPQSRFLIQVSSMAQDATQVARRASSGRESTSSLVKDIDSVLLVCLLKVSNICVCDPHGDILMCELFRVL